MTVSLDCNSCLITQSVHFLAAAYAAVNKDYHFAHCFKTDKLIIRLFIHLHCVHEKSNPLDNVR